MLLPVQPRENSSSAFCGRCEIAEMPNPVASPNARIPTLDDLLVHLAYRAERARTNIKDAMVSEMGITGEKDVHCTVQPARPKHSRAHRRRFADREVVSAHRNQAKRIRLACVWMVF